MPVIISRNISIPQLSYPLTHPRIGWRNILTDSASTVTVSSEDGDNVKENAYDGLTWDYWQPNLLPATLTVDASTAATADYVGIAAHTLGTNGNTVEVQYSDDGISYTTEQSIQPSDDEPIMALFTPSDHRYWRLRISGGTGNPLLGVVHIGKVLEMQQRYYVGATPPPMGRTATLLPTRSERGQYLGRSLRRTGVEAEADFEHLTATWYRSQMEPFVLHALTGAYFFAWYPSKYPEEIAYVWTNDPIVPENTGPGDLMSVSFTMMGVESSG